MTERSYLLFVESNTTGSGVHALRKARDLGWQPVLLTRKPVLYAGAAETGATIVVCETNELSELRRAIDGLLAEQPGTVAGITTTSEFYVETVAVLAAERGLPTNPPEMIRACRNKGQTRQRLTAAGLPQPRFVIVEQIAQLPAAIAAIGLPCVVKPADDTGSFGVRLCATSEELHTHAAELLAMRTNVRGQSNAGAILCEEYIDAPEFSVETFAWNGAIVCVGITQKQVSTPPFFVELGHVFPAALTQDAARRIEETTLAALRLLGNRNGPVHTEVKLTPRGCVIVEINPRLAGGMIPELVLQATGIDLLTNQLLAASNREPELEPRRRACAGIVFLTAPDAGIFGGVPQIEALRVQPAVVQAVITKAVGQPVQAPRSAYDRLGYVILQAEDRSALAELLRQAQQQLQIVVEPAPAVS
jgi:S-sulfo-L-cysteine synthase (3-phospho-L-serine-dependent)